MKARRLEVALTILLVLVISLTACTQTTPAPQPTNVPAQPAQPTQAEQPAQPEQPSQPEEPAPAAPTDAPSVQPVTITFWHAMSGSRGDVITAMVQRFMDANPHVTVEVEYTGSYAETLTKALASYRTGQPPTIVQVYEVGTQSMLDSEAIIPVYTLNKGDIDFNDVVPPIRKYYSVQNELYCMPFNSSTAMVYYNKDMFTAANLDPDTPPTTWAEIEEASLAIMEAGLAEGGISMGWPAWIFEQMFAYHDQLFANQDNGRSGLADKVLFNSDFGVAVMSEWQRMAKENVLVYGGREYAANDPFLAGQFPFLIQSTSSLGGILKSAEFEVGTTFLPRISDDYPKGNSVVGGGCLWVMDKATPEQQNAVYEFFKFTFSNEESMDWHKKTGYFPTTTTSYEELQKEGWFEAEPNHATAFDQILSGVDTAAANGVLLGNFVQIRDIVGAAIEDVVVNNVAPKTALEKAEADSNQVLEDYGSLIGQ